jgi:hypothetical protein
MRGLLSVRARSYSTVQNFAAAIGKPVEEVEANLPPEPVPNQGSVAPDATILNTYCGYCACGGTLDTDGIAHFCPRYGAYDVKPQDYGGMVFAPA